MDNKNYKSRIIDSKVELYLKTFGAICIEGPKWCGKTWCSAHHSNSEIYIANPEGGFQNRRLAELSPELILEGENPRLIDEWQEVPAIWDAVRYKIDTSDKKGQFILTGSSTPNHKGILHSGAGRIARIRMHTMSLYETGDSSGKISLEQLCTGKLTPAMSDNVNISQIIEYIIRGGWPGSIGLSLEQARLVPKEYLEAILNDDVYRLDGVKRNTSKMRLLLRSLARNESTTVTNRTLKNDIREKDDEDIDVDTVREYLDIFERLFITDNQQPFGVGIRSSVRVKQSVKRHLSDPSLSASLLGATKESLINDLETLGFLFEALCERDLKIYAEAFGASLYHYQDYRGNEIDAVIEMPDGKWTAIEIKLGANQIDSAAENLLKIQKEISEDPKGRPPAVLCVLCGMSNAAYRRPDGVFVVPLTMLRE